MTKPLGSTNPEHIADLNREIGAFHRRLTQHGFTDEQVLRLMLTHVVAALTVAMGSEAAQDFLEREVGRALSAAARLEPKPN